MLDLDTLLDGGAAVIEWGGYADLGDFAPATVSIDGGDDGAQPIACSAWRVAAAEHLARAWAALPQRAAATP